MQPHFDYWLLSLTFLNVGTIMFTDFDLKKLKIKNQLFSVFYVKTIGDSQDLEAEPVAIGQGQLILRKPSGNSCLSQ